jgi:hypothetical protein
MIGRTVKLICGIIGVVIVSAFCIGLSHSISTGFAGFWGGLPFAIITAFVLGLIVYDFWDECVRKEDNP